jgi:hypothetical protein
MTATRVRLGWETRLDQLTLAIDLALLGIGLVLAGALVHWHGWLAHTFGILLIAVGAIFCLVDGIRLLGWRTLLWPRSLRLDEQSISDDTKKNGGFRVDWVDYRAVGVVDDPVRQGLLLVFFPRSRSHDSRLGLYAGFGPAGWPQPLAATIPRRTGAIEAILAGKPGDWQPHRVDGWAALISAADEQVEAMPVPPPGRPAQRIDVSSEIAWQALIGGALGGLFGVLAYLAAFGVLANTGTKAAFLVVGTPFLLIGLATLLSLPVVIRRRWVVIDHETFTWSDPSETSFTVGWNELTSVSVEIITVPSASLSRHSVHIWLTPADDADFVRRHPELKLFADDGRYVLRLGDVVGPAKAIAATCQSSAPGGVWQGVAEHTGTFGIR